MFSDGRDYSEFNSGSGEFIMATTVKRINRLPNNSILLLDEPEISIHPGAQKRFIKYLLKKILSKKLQIIISTHSPSIVEDLPSICIKNFFVNANDNQEIMENVNYLEAFYNLEYSVGKKNIIVEDELAKRILNRVLEEENYKNIVDANYYPGGAESVKTLLITAYSKSEVNDKYIVFDGDKYLRDLANYEDIPEKYKTLDFYSEEFKSVTGVNSSTIKWGIDGNKEHRNKTQQETQLKNLLIKYLDFYKSNVFFFPGKIPEEIIFDMDYTKVVFPYIDLNIIESTINFKEKFAKVAQFSGIDIKSLTELYIANFVRRKKQSLNYKSIKALIEKILN